MSLGKSLRGGSARVADVGSFAQQDPGLHEDSIEEMAVNSISRRGGSNYPSGIRGAAPPSPSLKHVLRKLAQKPISVCGRFLGLAAPSPSSSSSPSTGVDYPLAYSQHLNYVAAQGGLGYSLLF